MWNKRKKGEDPKKLCAIGANFDRCNSFVWIARMNMNLNAHFSPRRRMQTRGRDLRWMILVINRLFVFAHRFPLPEKAAARLGAINYRGDNGRERSPWISLITTHVTEFARNIGISRKSGLLRKKDRQRKREREKIATKIRNIHNTSHLETSLSVR